MKQYYININAMVGSIVVKCIHVKRRHIFYSIVQTHIWMVIETVYPVKDSGVDIKMRII